MTKKFFCFEIIKIRKLWPKRIYITDITKMLPRCYQDVTKMLPRYYQDITKMLPRCYNDVTKMLPRCYQDVTKIASIVSLFRKAVDKFLPVLFFIKCYC